MTDSITVSLLNLRQHIKNAMTLQTTENMPSEVAALHIYKQLPNIIAVSKKIPAKIIKNFYLAGQKNFGESYLQEALNKFQELEDCKNDIIWHFIGPLQSNKLRKIVQHFTWIHSVDSYKIAQKISEYRQTLTERSNPINICLQINISGEPRKRGIHVDEAIKTATQIATLPAICLRGIMAIPQATKNYDEQMQAYKNLAIIFHNMVRHGLKLDTISAGMSNDYKAAIAAGSTTLRIGSMLFGNR